MSDAVPVMTPEPTQDDRTMATLAHVLQLVGWFIAPLVIFLIKRESRFVSFHSLQALLLQLLYMVVGGVLMGGWFVIMFATVFRHSGPQNGPPPPVFFFFPLIWLGFMGLWVVMLVVAIVYGVKAGRGEWAEYPVLGAVARRILKIGPDGASLQS
ncbi:MAG TPA: DUF4870 domain-containing protein [Terriglobales bacterium]|nr:DUF4870 domain-containing protein [Terriglobales bacterium]